MMPVKTTLFFILKLYIHHREGSHFYTIETRIFRFGLKYNKCIKILIRRVNHKFPAKYACYHGYHDTRVNITIQYLT